MNTSPPWNRTTKIFVTVIALFLIGLLLQRFQPLVAPLAGAAILAYLLNPIIIFLDKRLPISRGASIVIVYILLAIVLAVSGAFLSVTTYQQTIGFINDVPVLIDDVVTAVSSLSPEQELFHYGPIAIFPADIPWQSVGDQLLGMIQPALTQSGGVITQIATTTFRVFIMTFFVFMVSIYIAIEIPLMGGRVGSAFASPGYQYDAERLFRDFGRVWSSYLRGQVVLGLIIFVIVWAGLSLLGVRYALALAIFAGLLEFVPNVGAIISTTVAMLVAFFQPENYLGLAPWVHTLAVFGFMFIVQQLENNILVPRIMGNALDLHPLIVITGVFIGGSMAGILGAVLAAPIIASIKLIGTYGWRKLFDLPPFTDLEAEGLPPSLFDQGRGLATQFTDKIRLKQEEE